MIYKIGICDDEEMMIKINESYLQNISERNHKKISITSFLNGESLLEYATLNQLDIVFLDIDMVGINGLETADALGNLQKDIVIIFITGYKEYAYQAFGVNAIDYLIKPLMPDKIEKALLKAMELVVMKKNNYSNKALIITENNIKTKIQQRTILYIEKTKNQCILHTLTGNKSCYKSLKEILKELEPYFWQINQGIIVNSNYIQKIEGEQILLKNYGFFTLGRKYKNDIKNSFFT